MYFITNFNPLSPHGERLLKRLIIIPELWKFQSTLPAWGETIGLVLITSKMYISIHSPRMGRDQMLTIS